MISARAKPLRTKRKLRLNTQRVSTGSREYHNLRVAFPVFLIDSSKEIHPANWTLTRSNRTEPLQAEKGV